MTSEHTYHGLSSEDLSTVVYVVGHNLSGYLPESEPFFTTDETTARSVLADDLDRLWDSLEQMPEEDRSERDETEIGEVTEAHTEVNLVSFPYAWSIGYSTYWVGTVSLAEVIGQAAEAKGIFPSDFESVEDVLDALNGDG
jgi:hypothetical protein